MQRSRLRGGMAPSSWACTYAHPHTHPRTLPRVCGNSHAPSIAKSCAKVACDTGLASISASLNSPLALTKQDLCRSGSSCIHNLDTSMCRVFSQPRPMG